MTTEHPYDRVARELVEVGTSALGFGPDIDFIFTVRDHPESATDKLLRTELVVGEYHRATLRLSMEPILPPGVPWGGAINEAVVVAYHALPDTSALFAAARQLIEPAIPPDERQA